VRARLALAMLHAGAEQEAAAAVEPPAARADDGPRGALFAAGALRALAGADWGSHLAAAHRATLARWVAALQPAAAPPPASPAAARAERERLTSREMEVLALIAHGDSNKLIARALDLSPFTVKRHVAHILDKLDLASRGQAAAWYHAHAGSA
jgi:LuxR family maltose regulon positive regulatory protein